MSKKMNLLLFHRITEAIEAPGRGDAVRARTVLIRAQQDAEKLYVEETEE